MASVLLAMASNLLAFLLLVAMPGAPSSFLLLVVSPGAPSSVLAPRRDGLGWGYDLAIDQFNAAGNVMCGTMCGT